MFWVLLKRGAQFKASGCVLFLCTMLARTLASPSSISTSCRHQRQLYRHGMPTRAFVSTAAALLHSHGDSAPKSVTGRPGYPIKWLATRQGGATEKRIFGLGRGAVRMMSTPCLMTSTPDRLGHEILRGRRAGVPNFALVSLV
jgi:hypothetical protein